jgi:hypothetical protein
VARLPQRRAEDAAVTEGRPRHAPAELDVLGITLCIGLAVVEYERPDHIPPPWVVGERGAY